MTEKKLTTGLDRFLSKRWADYALDLRHSFNDIKISYPLLQAWLANEIAGQESALKTANQLRRLWLVDEPFEQLRISAIETGLADNLAYRTILHYGLAINVFPFFRDLCSTIGRLCQLQGKCERKEVKLRLLEKYGSLATIDHSISSGFLTLNDWGLISNVRDLYVLKDFELADIEITEWFIRALIATMPNCQASLSDIAKVPVKLGIGLGDVRSVIRQSNALSLEWNGALEEVIKSQL